MQGRDKRGMRNEGPSSCHKFLDPPLHPNTLNEKEREQHGLL